MCGIVYSHNFAGKPVNNDILQQYDKQKSRGQQGFGVFDGQELNMVHAAKENKILKWLVRYDSNLLLMHHRFPTSTINVKRAAHPFSTKNFFNKGKRKKDQVQYILVHNGSISNTEELYNKHFDMGIEYYSVLQDLTFNDSESLLWDFALYAEGKQKELTAKGGIAFICLKLEKGKLTKMYFARNWSSPLKMLKTKEGISLASELEGGEPIDVDTLYTWHYESKRLTSKELEVPGYTSRTYTPAKPSYAGKATDCSCNYVGWQECGYHGYAWGEHDTWGPGNLTGSHESVRNVLAKQFGDKFGLDKKGNTIIEYEQDRNTQMMVPKDSGENLSEVLTHEEQRRISETELINATNPITEDEITQEYMAYLAGARGVFETAYWMIEGDYMEAQEFTNTKENIRKRRLIEHVMERIDTDPDFDNDKSISQTWRDVWKSQE